MSNKITIKEWCQLQFKNVRDSVKLASKSLSKRLDGMNEIKGAMKDQQATFVTRDYVDSRLTANRDYYESKISDQQKQINDLGEEIEGLKLSRERLAGMASQKSVYLTAALALIAIAVSLFANK